MGAEFVCCTGMGGVVTREGRFNSGFEPADLWSHGMLRCYAVVYYNTVKHSLQGVLNGHSPG
ncbi:hypothetical protein D6827_02055 [Candidatus Parcubacteria bacterium]|nr:MAG: hypothetical protein D6827_02055 [Candidatus Parcubacteria bacterium]